MSIASKVVHRCFFLTAFVSVVALVPHARGQVPQPPTTERFSVQMFQGETKNCWIAVWPPSNNADGTPIAPGTKVQIKVYRSLDAGKTYKEQDVKVVEMGEGKVGQGERDAQEKEWIDCKLETPVDNAPPYAVWLAATAVVNGKESEKNNRYLTFRYREKDGGRPALVRFETPDVSGEGVADELARPLPQELPGKWGDGEFTIRSVYQTPAMKTKLEKGEVEGCNAAMLKSLGEMKDKPMSMVLDIKTIDLVQAPGLNGVPIGPEGLTKIIFPGTLTMTIQDPKNPQPAKEGDKMDFAYHYRDRFIKFNQTKDNTRFLMAGHFFKNSSKYLIFGTWRVIVNDPAAPAEYFEIRGTWTVSKNKPA